MVIINGYQKLEDEYRTIFANAMGRGSDIDNIPIELDFTSIHDIMLGSDARRQALLQQLTSGGQDFSAYVDEVLKKMAAIDKESTEDKKGKQALTAADVQQLNDPTRTRRRR